MAQGCFADCSLASNSFNREISGYTWTGNWTFEGVEVGTMTIITYFHQQTIINEESLGKIPQVKKYGLKLILMVNEVAYP